MVLCAGPVPAAQIPPSGTKILVYRGTPLLQLQSVPGQEPLSEHGQSSRAEEERASVPKRVARQPCARALSTRFAAERGVHACRHMCQLWLMDMAD